MKKAKFFTTLFAVVLLFSGCYDSREINETAYIIALGVDRTDKNAYTYTFQLANPLEMASGVENTEKKNPDSSVQNFVVTAPDFYIAKNQLNNLLSKNVDMSHLKLIVFSKALENSEFLQHSQFLMHERQVRPHTNVAVSTDTAEDFIKSVSPTLEANTAKYYELMGLRSDNLYAPSVTISAFLDELSLDDGAAALPLAHSAAKSNNNATEITDFWISTDNSQIQGNDASMQGMAIFKSGEITGYMDCDSALIFNILSGKIKTCTVTLKNPADKTSNLVFRLNVPKSAGYKLENKNNEYKINITQCLDIKFIGSFLPKSFKTETELYNFARQAITQKFTDFVYDLSRSKKTDILNIGNRIDCSLESPDHWQNIFETADFEVNIFN